MSRRGNRHEIGSQIMYIRGSDNSGITNIFYSEKPKSECLNHSEEGFSIEIIMKEQWKDIDGHNGIYQVSNKGRIRSWNNGNGGRLDNPKILSGSTLVSGHKAIDIDRNGDRTVKLVHRLVAEFFVDNPDNKAEVHHKDNNPANNHYSNLEWVSKSENHKKAWEDGVCHRGEADPKSKLTKREVLQIKAVYPFGWFTQKELGDAFGVSPSCINSIVNGYNWKHL